MSAEPLIAELEKKLDKEYAACFPADAAWEAAAIHLLLLFDHWAAENAEELDALKFPLMHAFRWGANARSESFAVPPSDAVPSLLESCWMTLSRAAEYVGICGAFVNYHRQVIGLRELAADRVAFTSNSEWQAFEILSAAIHRRSLGDEGRSIAMEIGSLAERSAALPYATVEVTLDALVSECELQELVRRIRSVTELDYQLPDSWSFDGSSIFDLRKFWDALHLLATFHLARASRGAGSNDFSRLMLWPKHQWVEILGRCSSLDRSLIERFIESLIYSRRHRTPDIALTPLLDLGNDLLVASPWMVFSSAMERNFCARLAREDPRYHQATESLHHEMAAQVARVFEQSGCNCRMDVPIETSLGNTEIDLLVWSPEERVVAAIELKWVIAVADVMEVFNRGDAAARNAIDRQLPKYAAALSAGGHELVRRVFDLPTTPRVDEVFQGLILRGHVGSSKTKVPGMFVIPEPLVSEHFEDRRSLREFCRWAIDMPFLPRLDHDFRSEQIVVRSPSGIQVEFFEPVPSDGGA